MLLFVVCSVWPAPCNGKVHLVADTHRHPDPASYSWASSPDSCHRILSSHDADSSRLFRGYSRRDKQRGVERQHYESASIIFYIDPGVLQVLRFTTQSQLAGHGVFTQA